MPSYRLTLQRLREFRSRDQSVLVACTSENGCKGSSEPCRSQSDDRCVSRAGSCGSPPFSSGSHNKLLGTDHPLWDWPSPESGVTQFRVQDDFSSSFPKFPTQQSGRPNLREAKTPARPCATDKWSPLSRGPGKRSVCYTGLISGCGGLSLCDRRPFIPVTSPEFSGKIAQQKRHCRAKPAHTTHRGIVWPASKAWQGIAI